MQQIVANSCDGAANVPRCPRSLNHLQAFQIAPLLRIEANAHLNTEYRAYSNTQQSYSAAPGSVSAPARYLDTPNIVWLGQLYSHILRRPAFPSFMCWMQRASCSEPQTQLIGNRATATIPGGSSRSLRSGESLAFLQARCARRYSAASAVPVFGIASLS
jgi:hypothetical protein